MILEGARNPDFCMPYGSEDGKIRWRGYGIESITTFLDDVIDLIEGRMDLEELQIQRPSFKKLWLVPWSLKQLIRA